MGLLIRALVANILRHAHSLIIRKHLSVEGYYVEVGMETGIRKAGETTEDEQRSGNNESVSPENNGETDGLDEEVIGSVADALDLSPVTRKTAEAIYRAAIEEEVHKGRPLARLQVACVPLAARVHSKPVALGRVTDVACEIEETHIEERRELSWTLKMVAKATGTNVPPTSAEEYITGIVEGIESDAEADEAKSGFSHPGTIITEARTLLMAESGEQASSGSSPSGVAAGAVSRISEERGEKVTKQQIADAAGVSCPTVLKYARSVEEDA